MTSDSKTTTTDDTSAMASASELPRRVFFLSSGSIDEPAIEKLRASDWEVEVCETAAQAHTLLSDGDYRVAVASIEGFSSRENSALQTLFAQHALYWIAIVPPVLHGNPKFAETIGQHFHDFHTHPVNVDALAGTVGHAFGMAMLQPSNRAARLAAMTEVDLIGDCPAMHSVLQTLQRAARVNAPTLILGESGSGKSLAARAIHALSAQAQNDFLELDCSLVPAESFEVEFFGEERITADGVRQVARVGVLEAAHDSTLHLANITSLSADAQTRILRFLETGSFSRVNSSARLDCAPRLVASTQENLEEIVESGQFREDLYYRMRVLCVNMPPLRERNGDLELLAEYFFKAFTTDRRSRVKGISHAAMAAMHRYHWPGNVRELRNRIRQAMILAKSNLIQPADLEFDDESDTGIVSLEQARIKAEGEYIRVALHRNYHNVTETAQQLGVSRVTLYRLMKKYRIDIGTERGR